MITRADQITEQSVNWLFKDRLPAGMLTLLSGDPDVGKTFFSMALAASVTTGGKFAPTETDRCEPGNVLVIHAEDSPEHTMLPRFVAAGGDRTRLSFLGGVEESDLFDTKTQQHPVDLQAHCEVIKNSVKELDQCRLVIVDPIGSFMGGKNSYKDEEVRMVLGALVDLAAETGAAVLVVAHHKKGESSSAQHMVMGSVAFTAVPRMVYSMYRDPNDPNGDRRLLLPVKHNITRKSKGFAFQIRSHKYQSDSGLSVETAKIEWDQQPPELSVDDVLQILSQRKRGDKSGSQGGNKRERARGLLQTLLKDGKAVPVEDVIAIGRDTANISAKTMRLAAKDLGVISSKGFGEKATWSLPQSGNDLPD